MSLRGQSLSGLNAIWIKHYHASLLKIKTVHKLFNDKIYNMSLENWGEFSFQTNHMEAVSYISGFSLTSRCTALFHSAHTLRHLRPCGRQTPVIIRQ